MRAAVNRVVTAKSRNWSDATKVEAKIECKLESVACSASIAELGTSDRSWDTPHRSAAAPTGGRNQAAQGTVAHRQGRSHAVPSAAATGDMAATSNKLTTAMEAYLANLRRVHGSRAGTSEPSYFPALDTLFRAVVGSRKPKVFPVPNLKNRGAGDPDFGLYAARQMQRGRPLEGQVPERGVIEVKAADDNAWRTAKSEQVTRCWKHYRQVLVTNACDWLLFGQDAAGHPSTIEPLRLAENDDEFWRKVERPRALARDVGPRLAEYLRRHDLRRMSQRRSVLVQHSRSRLGLPSRRLSGAQEMALLQRSRRSGPPALARRSAAPSRHRTADRLDPPADWIWRWGLSTTRRVLKPN